MPSCAKALGLPRHRLRENWSSTMTSASRPSGVARHAHSSPCAALACRAPKRSRISASKASSRAKRRVGGVSSNQKCSTFSGDMAVARRCGA